MIVQEKPCVSVCFDNVQEHRPGREAPISTPNNQQKCQQGQQHMARSTWRPVAALSVPAEAVPSAVTPARSAPSSKKK